ncbi:MAG: D-2-hydroxyacid dehydrogenase [Bacteroidaceae bacterium]|nr:D-2-hydroxyacid dehydrogenase [Bacteroidaceae bacterium]
MTNLVILDGYPVIHEDLTWGKLAQFPDVSLTAYDFTPASQVVERCREADAVLTNKVVFSREVIGQLPRLRYIGVLATGYNVVDVDAAHERGITVTNVPAYSTASVTQMVFAHLLNVTNRVAHYARANREGAWARSRDFMWMDTPLTELQDKTFVVRGMGNIGRQVARVAQAFGMRVLAVTSQDVLPDGIEKVGWEQGLRQADVLSLHCPLTKETEGMMDASALALMKPTAILINTGRGPLVVEADVAQALRDGRLGAYCADVLSQEPARADNPLLSAPRCQLTPHIAWASCEARQRLIGVATDNFRRFLAGKPVNVV